MSSLWGAVVDVSESLCLAGLLVLLHVTVLHSRETGEKARELFLGHLLNKSKIKNKQ
jgi:hypothetical protein